MLTSQAIDNGLTPKQLDITLNVLAPFADKIVVAGLFGSRAIGTSRPNSDIDLVLYGDLTEELIDELWTRFDESALPIDVDVCAYDLILYPPLKAHIDAVMKPLFTQQQLQSAACKGASF